ncbi:MAG TPA: prepilin peptidase [Bacillales bacterium]
MAGWATSVVVVSVVIAIYTDLRWMIIPDWLTYNLLFSGILYYWIQGDILHSLLSGLVGGMLFLIPALLGQVGMGDVKWFAGIGAWTTISFVLMSFVFATVIGFFHIIGLLFWKRVVQQRKYCEIRNEPVPYAVSLGIGIIVATYVANTGMVTLSI